MNKQTELNVVIGHVAIGCTDREGRVGSFIYSHTSEAGRVAISPVLGDCVALFDWLRVNGWASMPYDSASPVGRYSKAVEVVPTQAVPAPLFDINALPDDVMKALAELSPMTAQDLKKGLTDIANPEGLEDHEVPRAVFMTANGDLWAFNEHSLMSFFPEDEDAGPVWEFYTYLGEGVTLADAAALVADVHGEIAAIIYQVEGM